MEKLSIYEAIPCVMADIKAVTKEKRSSFGDRFQYRGIDDVMNTLKPILAKHKVFVVPVVEEMTREDKITAKGSKVVHTLLRIRYTFYAADGSNIQSVVIGEGMDSGDKSANKAMAIALKYAFFQVFCIPTEEMPDPDSEGYVLGTDKQQRPAQQRPAQQRPVQANNQFLTDMMKKTIEAELARTGLTTAAVCNWCHASSFDTIKAAYYKQIMERLKGMQGGN